MRANVAREMPRGETARRRGVEKCRFREAGELAGEQSGEDEREKKEQNRRNPQSLDPARHGERDVLDEEVQRCAAPIDEHIPRRSRRTTALAYSIVIRLVEVQWLPPHRRQRERRTPGSASASAAKQAGVQGSVRAMTPPTL